MKITQERIEKAVLQIFSDFSIPSGGRLLFTDLRLEWPKTGLRSSDLIQGVKALTFNGELELDDTSEGPVFILTATGHARMKTSSSTLGLRPLVSNGLGGFFGLGRNKSAAPATGRRVTDDSRVAA